MIRGRDRGGPVAVAASVLRFRNGSTGGAKCKPRRAFVYEGSVFFFLLVCLRIFVVWLDTDRLSLLHAFFCEGVRVLFVLVYRRWAGAALIAQ